MQDEKTKQIIQSERLEQFIKDIQEFGVYMLHTKAIFTKDTDIEEIRNVFKVVPPYRVLTRYERRHLKTNKYVIKK